MLKPYFEIYVKKNIIFVCILNYELFNLNVFIFKKKNILILFYKVFKSILVKFLRQKNNYN